MKLRVVVWTGEAIGFRVSGVRNGGNEYVLILETHHVCEDADL